MRLLRSANAWLFGYGSPATIGLLRILTGLLALVNFSMIAVDFDAWFTERGHVPWSTAERWLGDDLRLSLLNGVADVRVTAAVYALTLLAALATMVGFQSRIASILLALGTVSLHIRNPIILHGGDTMLRMLTIYVAVAPSGAALSIDRRLALRKGAPVTLALVSLWPQRLVQIQVAIVYFTTVWHKWLGTTWRDGTATWYPSQLHEFDRFPVPDWLYQPPFLQITTYGTLAVELALATLVFHSSLRKWVLLAGVILHLYIEYSMNIPLFAAVMISSYVSFYEGDEVSRWLERTRKRFFAGARPPTPAVVEGEEEPRAESA